jgi:hypothetical protein
MRLKPRIWGPAGRPGTTGTRNKGGWLAPARVLFPFYPKPRGQKNTTPPPRSLYIHRTRATAGVGGSGNPGERVAPIHLHMNRNTHHVRPATTCKALPLPVQSLPTHHAPKSHPYFPPARSLALPCLIHAVAGRTFPAGERGSAAICLLYIESECLGGRAARCALRCSARSSCRAGSRGLGSHWVAHACMGVASSCVCCKPVAEGGAGVDLRILRGARKRSIIWARGPGRNSSALTQPRLPDARPRGGRCRLFGFGPPAFPPNRPRKIPLFCSAD